MIPNATSVATVESNMDGESGKFTLDASSMAHLMGVLSKLYADSELAVVREYLTNAYDSHIEAGTTRPVEVTLPSRWYSNYSIRDFGVGMDVDDIKNTYSKYGASTKRTSNKYVGTLGLGSKSALAYTTQFTVIGYKHGIKTTALIALDEAGVPEFSIVDTCASDEDTGFEVIVPVKDYNSFEQKTANFLQYWEPGLVKVNGREPAYIDKKFVKDFTRDGKTAKVYRSETAYGQSFIVMGNVPYPIDRSQIDSSIPGVNFVAYVPIGTVTIAPSREALNYTPATSDFIKALVKEMTELVVKSYRDEIENAPNIRAAAKSWSDISSNGIKEYLRGTKWNGHSIQNSYVSCHSKEPFYTIETRQNWDDRRVEVNNSATLNTEVVVPLVITGLHGEPTIGIKRRAVHYLENEIKWHDPLTNNRWYYRPVIVFSEQDVVSPWWVDAKRVDVEKIRKHKIPPMSSRPAGVRVETPPYLQWTVDKTGNVSRESKVEVPTKNLLYMTPADLVDPYNKKSKRTTFGSLVATLPTDYTLVEVERNRQEKFLRNNPHAGEPSKIVQQAADGIFRSATNDDTIAYFASQSALYRVLRELDANKVDDPTLKTMIKSIQNAAAMKDNPWERLRALKSTWSCASVSVVYAEPSNPVNDKALFKKYPMIESVRYGTIGSKMQNHITHYINMVYKENI